MMLGEGCAVYCPGQQATDFDILLVKTILELSGICQLVPESMIDAVGALAGCGPAFVCNVNNLITMNLDRQLHYRYTSL